VGSLEIKIKGPIKCGANNCVFNKDGVCTREELFITIKEEEFRGRGEPDYRLPLIVLDRSKCFRSRDSTNILAYS
jgi:hypothetical protein